MNKPLSAEKLSNRCDPARFGFTSTEELAELDRLPGQARAAEAIGLAVAMDREGYNLFVTGSRGTGKRSEVKRAIAARSATAARQSDWVYVNNFADPNRPIAIELPPGSAVRLRDDLTGLLDELRAGIPAVFESEEYGSRVESIDAEFKERHEKAFSALGEDAISQGIALLRTPTGFSFAPVKDSEVMSQEDFAKLPEEEQKRLEKAIEALQARLEKLVREVMRWRKERFERVRALNSEMTMMVAGHLVEALKQRHFERPKVVAYLDALLRDVLERADDFKRPAVGGEQPLMQLVQSEGNPLRRYEINVLVDRSLPDGNAVVETDHPTHQNLIGRVDHIARFGNLLTDFGLIKAGDLHRANGGWLLLDAAKLLGEPYAWQGLKRALLRGEIRIESLAEMYGVMSTTSLFPEPIPLQLKVILFGDRTLFYLLQEYDPDFVKLFRVVADFEDEVDRGEDAYSAYARLVATLARRDGLLPLGREAVARVIDHASRLAGDARKLSANVRLIGDLIGEADHYARQAQRQRLEPEDVLLAAEAQRRRAGRVQDGVRESILRGKILIDTEGAKTGQVNGLSVFQLGDFTFAQPTRITATTRLGDGQVIDIQGEVRMGGAIHSKGVKILAAYLGARYSAGRPHALAATLVFEQTYGKVDGDSASLAELCALLSSLADAPVRQFMAVTGSINQFGEVQPIGAVNEKIEGFFDVCRSRGLSGCHGVIIPAANVDNLMLREDVIEAAVQGRFHVYSVETADQAMELLTGLPAGEPYLAAAGMAATINARVLVRLREYATARQPRRERNPPARATRRGRDVG